MGNSRSDKEVKYALEFKIIRDTPPKTNKVRVEGFGIGHVQSCKEKSEGKYVLKVIVYTDDVHETIFQMDKRMLTRTIN